MVNIYQGICDCHDLCKNKDCIYYPISKNEIRKVIEEIAKEGVHPWKKPDKITFVCPILNPLSRIMKSTRNE